MAGKGRGYERERESRVEGKMRRKEKKKVM